MGTVKALDWLYEKGMQELAQSDYESARKRFQRILNMTRESEWVEKANAGLSRVYLAEENMFWAMDHIRRALKRDANNHEYRYIKGLIHAERQEWSKSADEALRAVEWSPENGIYYQLLAKAVYHCEGYKQARNFIEWAVECDPTNVDIRLDFARIEVREGHFQEALKILKDSLDEASDDERIRRSIRAIQENWEITGS